MAARSVHKAALTAAAAGAAGALLLALAGPAGGAVAEDGAPTAAAIEQSVPGEILVRLEGEKRERVVELSPHEDPAVAIAELERDGEVAWAAPNATATIAGGPRDPGRSGVRGGWRKDQWNFLKPAPRGERCRPAAPCGINALGARKLLRQYGFRDGRNRDGSRGLKVAVLDTGVAYRKKGKRFRRSPDLARKSFTPGRDFVDGDRVPLDRNGHGTHVASTIVERTNNKVGVTGIADGLRVMPVRVLNGRGVGTARDVAQGIRWATRNGARVINLSLEFGSAFPDCDGLKGVCEAIADARGRGIVVVSAAGNHPAAEAQMPAKVSFGVASGTVRGCLSRFSARGPGVDLTAPGGGPDWGPGGRHCRPRAGGPSIVQMTLRNPGPRFRKFGYPRFEGTSMAAPHVSAAAALVLQSRLLQRRLGRRPTPGEVEDHLRCTARPAFDPATAPSYGAGLLDLRAAVDRNSRC
jgi:serine protease